MRSSQTLLCSWFYCQKSLTLQGIKRKKTTKNTVQSIKPMFTGLNIIQLLLLNYFLTGIISQGQLVAAYDICNLPNTTEKKRRQ